ncbi:cell division protein ZipA [uncultured Gilvimarinus sp.]|uniref:cell division protein ZipA n=1 Tax=uncultured Gilvimarinus sp. TaxID=1689143 RepID=UPI0030EDC3F2|tara:strand:+ start:5058 stop:6011 length:954 start_codon:yes stop_codon:yes gene_type:complete
METWLTIIVVLLIVGILLDGWRRMRASRRDAIRVSKRAKRFDSSGEPFDEPFTSELPNGGARVVGTRDDEPGADEHTPAATSKSRIPQQVTLNLDESVPMLMESVEQNATPETAAQAQASEPYTGDDDFDSGIEDRVEPSFSAIDEPEESAQQSGYQEPSFSGRDEPDAAPEQPDEVVIINVMAPEGHQFSGSALLDVLLQCGMRFGDMNIFHRHAHETGEGPVLFSLANMVKPGVFDLENMASFHTPGVSLFMTLPMRPDSLKSFDIMRDVAQALADNLCGELKDENRSVMTRQTMEHCRQRIAEYERKRLSRATS